MRLPMDAPAEAPRSAAGDAYLLGEAATPQAIPSVSPERILLSLAAVAMAMARRRG
jgi:hypothetical protein